MAHEIDMSNGRANMAYVGEVPWHGLGSELQEGASIDEWLVAAGMNFTLHMHPVMYYNPKINAMRVVDDRRVIVRDDTHEALSVTSATYELVQPRDVLEFYRDLVSAAGFRLNTAGVLRGGRKYWALAELGEEAMIGVGVDKMKGYLLLATSCDMSLASTGMFTGVRVVCANTLSFAVTGAEGDAKRHVKVPHSRVFNPAQVKAQLGIASASWHAFIEQSRKLAETDVEKVQAVEWLARVFGDAEKTAAEQDASATRTMQRVLDLFNGAGRGSDLPTAAGTAWGLVNAATEYLDHHRNERSPGNRLDRAWFGDGAVLKQRAWDEALALVTV